jgi:hypothetical protein
MLEFWIKYKLKSQFQFQALVFYFSKTIRYNLHTITINVTKDQTNFSLSAQPSAGSEMKPHLKEWGCENAMTGQAYRTPQGILIE